MKLVPFVLEAWLGKYRDSVQHHLGMSTGPTWTLAELRALMTDDERDAFDGAALSYCPTNGRETLRAALASMYGAGADEIIVLNGGAEALLTLFFVASEPGANVIVPTPSFAPFIELPSALGVETRRYALRFEDGFAVHPDEVIRLADARTKLILVNTPHNPSGASPKRPFEPSTRSRSDAAFSSSSTRFITRFITALGLARPASTRARACSAISRRRSVFPACA